MSEESKYPFFKSKAFICPYCNAYSKMWWRQYQEPADRGGHYDTDIFRCMCSHCERNSYWYSPDEYHFEGKMILPGVISVPLPHSDMPESLLDDFNEARNISSESPRGATALLRLVIQTLCKELGEKGKNINNDIGELVKKGLPIEIQQALDIVRVVGNNAVHPGELNKDDVTEVTNVLFELVNQIIEERIAKPKKLQALFDKLPESAKKGIDDRDNK